MRSLRALTALVAATLSLWGGAAAAQAVASPPPVTSLAPDRVAVSIYRDPNRDPANNPDPDWLGGYALITETRTITIPAGQAVIRFEGVAGGILPESAIITGLPSGVREKNLDADLLSPRSLYARSYGRPVTIRTTLGGRVTEEQAIIRSGPDGAAILQTSTGFIAANCGPGDDALVYHSVPAGLSARPTLSVETEAATQTTVTLTLSYLAWGFDWQANYIATMRPDGRTADLFAWVTLSNSDVTSFADAETVVIAGRLQRTDRRPYAQATGAPLNMSCFYRQAPDYPKGVAMPAPSMMMRSAPEAAEDQEIIVTGSRVMVRQEDLGDLKLYRVPIPTTVASMSQKQVALLDRTGIPVAVIYRARLWRGGGSDESVDIVLRTQNRVDHRLGLPLPAGRVAVFQPRGDTRLLIGEGSTADKAVGEEVEIVIAEAGQVKVSEEQLDSGDNDWETHLVTVTNANPYPVRFEGDFEDDSDWLRSHVSARLQRRNGRSLWVVDVPANGTATLRFRLTETDD